MSLVRCEDRKDFNRRDREDSAKIAEKGPFLNCPLPLPFSAFSANFLCALGLKSFAQTYPTPWDKKGLPVVHGSVELAIDGQVGALVRIFRGQCLV